MSKARAYTLTELLVALTIVLVLAALLAPVVISTKSEAKKVACISNYKQVGLASTLYLVDYDDRYFVSKYTAGRDETPEKDRTWVQLVFPYMRGFELIRCPADYTQRPGLDPVFDPHGAFGANIERYYTISTRSNIGFNSVYLSPLVRERNGVWIGRPKSGTEIQDPSTTLLFADSVWEVLDGGTPSGGGSYLIVPPCRYVAPNREDSFGLIGVPNDRIFTASKFWDDSTPPRRIQSGGLWAWHGDRLTTMMSDGSVKLRTMDELSNGCQVKPDWGGLVTDTGRYVWDLR